MASHMVMGKCHRQFVLPHPMVVCLGNQHSIHPAVARGDEVELRTAVAVPSGQGDSRSGSGHAARKPGAAADS